MLLPLARLQRASNLGPIVVSSVLSVSSASRKIERLIFCTLPNGLRVGSMEVM